MLFTEFNVEDMLRVRSQEAFEKGMLNGRLKGEEEKAKEIAKKMKEAGINPALIQQMTGIVEPTRQ